MASCLYLCKHFLGEFMSLVSFLHKDDNHENVHLEALKQDIGHQWEALATFIFYNVCGKDTSMAPYHLPFLFILYAKRF